MLCSTRFHIICELFVVVFPALPVTYWEMDDRMTYCGHRTKLKFDLIMNSLCWLVMNSLWDAETLKVANG